MIAPSHVPPNRVYDVDIYDLPGQVDDFHCAWKALQDGSPDLVWTPQNEGHWIVLRGSLLAEVQSDHQRFSNRVIVLPKSVGEMHGLIPTTIDPPEHRPYRILLNEKLAPGAVRGMRDHIRATAAELINEFAGNGQCDFSAQYAQIFPIRIFMKLVGLPLEDAAQLKIWAESMTRPNPPIPFADARQALFDYVMPVIAKRKARSGDDLISHIVNAQMSDEEAMSLVTQVLIAGLDTVVNFLGFAMRHLAEDASACAWLAQDMNRILPAVHEIFRRYGLVTIAREVRADTQLDGVLVKAGEMICIPTQVHGLDDRVTACPMQVDFTRTRTRHSAFGSGVHMCPGQELARLEVAITIEEWLKLIPEFRVDAASDLHCSGGIVGQLNRLVLAWHS